MCPSRGAAQRHGVCVDADQVARKTVDLLFTSVAMHARTRAIGVVLRGAWSDRSRGLAEIHLAARLADTAASCIVKRGRAQDRRRLVAPGAMAATWTDTDQRMLLQAADQTPQPDSDSRLVSISRSVSCSKEASIGHLN
ncbi:chemotaxis protein CheB [Mesorhizobium sp.]|uniref:chemotaxis protein CheB n=1 Tax=Mesorhizobium sp. TaxID=1871066 RepID=UPI0025D779D7|nr:chemotaxis protein CheB [Mesorhizobium sp.]